MSTICPDKDITVDGRIVMESEHDPFMVLLEGEDLLGHVNFVGGNPFEQQIVQLWTREHQRLVCRSSAKEITRVIYEYE